MATTWEDDLRFLPVTLMHNAVQAIFFVSFERYLFYDFAIQLGPHAPISAGSAAAARWFRWVQLAQSCSAMLSMLFLGTISDRLRSLTSGVRARTPLLVVQLCARCAFYGIVLLQMSFALPIWLQLVGAVVNGLCGGEGNALIASLYTMRGEALASSLGRATRERDHAERANAFMRLQMAFSLGQSAGSWMLARS